jgi:acetyltransferase-like isoleucine patch superfamily enzyme
VGSGCTFEPGVFLMDAKVGSDVCIGANSVLRRCRIDDNQNIPPMSCINRTET